MKTLHIINSLPRSGAENALLRLAIAMKEDGDEVSVIALKDGGELHSEFERAGIPVSTVGLSFGPGLPGAVLRLARAIRATDADVVHTWLYHSNLIGGVVSRLVRPRTPVVWGIHHSILKRKSSKPTTRLVSTALAALSRFVPSRIVYCAHASRRAHEAAGYAKSRGLVIPNGIQTHQFAPDGAARDRVRQELGLGDEAVAIGIVARFHPDKDIPTFVRAAGILAKQEPRARFVLVGTGLGESNGELRALVEETGHRSNFLLVGPRSDIPSVLNALDITTLSSLTEAFPVSLIEAMATGIPCVSTDVGDAAEIIGATGRVVPVGDASALAAAWSELIGLDPSLFGALKSAARHWVEQTYRLETTVSRHRELYRALGANGHRRRL